MAMETMERVPDGLREAYAADLGDAPYTTDDVVAGGRARVRRRRVGAAGVAAAVAALAVGAVNLAPLGGDRADVTPPAATSGTTASAAAYPGCVDRPTSCLDVVAAWSRAVAGSTARVQRQDAAGYEAGTVVLAQTVSSIRQRQDVYLSVVIAPTDLTAEGQVRGPEGPTKLMIDGFGEPVDRLVRVGGGNRVETWSVAPVKGGHPAVEVALNVANQGPAGSVYDEASSDVSAPGWWTEDAVANLLNRLLGPAVVHTDVAVGTPTRTASTTPTGDCSRDPESCRAAFRVWTDTYHLNIGNYGTTTDASSGPGARLFTGTPVDNQVDPPPGIEMLVGGTDPGPQPGETRTTVAGLPAWTSTRDTDVGVRTSLRFDAVDGKRGSVELSVLRPKSGPTPEALSDAAVTDLLRLVYGRS
ncbi:hypothetical protein [Knoellia koreensis]|uniref:Uncharacterized protein n=1 Tax=Knoellia koreensis TaxID=2730921 RepID=A0A849HTI7_9MICO|nr:hypothetical protein [Knoellia sp. DB2414S]NNM47897.1 hypothetical protein [Knoellia sp. DB2414S]